MVKLEDGREVYGIIYKITNLVNGKVYIGQTTRKRGIRDRYAIADNNDILYGIYKYHKKLFDKKEWKSCNVHLYKSIEKYGVDNFQVIEVLDVANNAIDLDEKEIRYICEFNSIEDGYNKAEGGHLINITSETSFFAKITPEIAIEIKRLLFEGVCYNDICKKFNVSKNIVYYISMVKTWINYGEEYNEKLSEMYQPKGEPLIKYEEEIFELYFNQNMKTIDIANMYNVSRSSISRIIKLERDIRNGRAKKCQCCGNMFSLKYTKPTTNRKRSLIVQQKYCDNCKKEIDRNKSKERMRRKRNGGND